MTYEEIKSRFHDRITKDSGDSFLCSCPGHDDDKASLSIAKGDKDGVTVVKCFAGCEPAQILSPVGLTVNDLFSTNGTHNGTHNGVYSASRNGATSKKTPSKSDPVVATYEYKDASGKLAFRVQRKQSKAFVQSHPDGTGGWVYKMDGVDRVLYRLPEIVASGAETWVLIPEGEKDCDNLHKAGYVATTNAGGAKAPWLDAYSESLRGRKVCILPDNDDPGRQHADDVAKHLAGIAADVRLLELPGLPEKGDVSDWLAAGNDPTTLLPLVESAPAAGSAQQSGAQTTTPPPASGGQQAAANSASVKLNKPTQIYELALKHCGIFTSDDGSVYAMVNMGGHVENMNVRSMRFRQWLGKLYYDKTGMVAGKSSCEEAMEILSFETGTTRETFLRVGGNGASIYIDLGNSQWEAVEIDASGWRILSSAPVSFRRTKKMKPLPTPVKVATADAALLELWQLVNIAPEDRILVLAWLLAAMRHKGPYPVLTLIAEAGSAKTTTAQALKRLISPYVAKTRSRPKTVEDIYVAANNDWILVYDNLSTIPQDISDAFCRLATGGGYATRELYENLEEVVIDRQQPLIINGVADIVRKGDLASRVLTVSLPEITADRRMDESEWEQRFADAHPRILGALLDLLSAVLAELPKVKTPLPRMADFAKMGVALDTAIGITGQPYSFAERYAESTRLGTMTIIENSPVYRPLWRFMKDHGRQWDGTASSLLEELRKKASSVELFNLPKASNALVRELSGIAPNLRSARIIDVRKERTKKGSHVSLAPLPDFDKGELDSPYVPDPLDSVPTP